MAAAAVVVAVLAAEAWRRPLVAHPLTDRGTVAFEGQMPAALMCDTNGPSEPQATSEIGNSMSHLIKTRGIFMTKKQLKK